MADDPKLDEIRDFLLAEITDVRLRVYAIQSLAQEGKPFSASDVDACIEFFRAHWDAGYQRGEMAQMKRETDDKLHRLLESYRGQKQ